MLWIEIVMRLIIISVMLMMISLRKGSNDISNTLPLSNYDNRDKIDISNHKNKRKYLE